VELVHSVVHSPHGVVHSKLGGPPVEARSCHPGTFPVRDGSGTASSCEYSTRKRIDMRCLPHNLVAWLLDCDVWVGRYFGMISLGMNIHPSFAVVLRSYGMAYS
jgi:hypothetical protein